MMKKAGLDIGGYMTKAAWNGNTTTFLSAVGERFSGVGLGWLAQHYGWNKVFPPLVACATISAILFAFLWNTTAERRSGKA